MKIRKIGTAHERYVWKTTCSDCESELEWLQGDPLATEEVCYNCDADQYYTRYVCPVCRAQKVAFTKSGFGGNGNATYEKIRVRREDIEDLRRTEILSDKERRWIDNRSRYWHSESE